MCCTVPDWIKRLRLPGPPANPRSCSEPALLTVRVQTQRLTKASAWGLWALLSLVPSTGRARVPPASTTKGPWWPRALDKVQGTSSCCQPSWEEPLFHPAGRSPQRSEMASQCWEQLWQLPLGCPALLVFSTGVQEPGKNTLGTQRALHHLPKVTGLCFVAELSNGKK